MMAPVQEGGEEGAGAAVDGVIVPILTGKFLPIMRVVRFF